MKNQWHIQIQDNFFPKQGRIEVIWEIAIPIWTPKPWRPNNIKKCIPTKKMR